MTRLRRVVVAIAVAASVALAAAGCAGDAGAARPMPAPRASATPSPAAFADGSVSVHGRGFRLAGRPFRFVGVNIYDAAASDRYSCRAGSRMSDAQLVSTLRYLHDEAGATVLRFWAYQTYTQGATYWAGVDRVLEAARETGMKVIPVLEDGPGDCTTGPGAKSAYRGDTWYTEGYRVPYGSATLSYRDYVRAVAEHYRDDPTILGWSLMNEAETTARDAQGRSVLVDFARDVAGVVRSVDPRHPITLGTQSNGAPGASGPDFTAVYSLPQLSFAEVHDWGYWGSDASAMPGGTAGRPPLAGSVECLATAAPVGCSFARAAALGKPLVVGEAGIQGTTPAQRALRARQLGAKMTAAFRAGASGYLIWSVTTGITDGYDVLTTDDDPLIPRMREVAAGLG